MTAKQDRIDKGPRARVERFMERRRQDGGRFLSLTPQPDGYIKVQFERAVYFTPPVTPGDYREPPIYREGYKRPVLKENTNAKSAD